MARAVREATAWIARLKTLPGQDMVVNQTLLSPQVAIMENSFPHTLRVDLQDPEIFFPQRTFMVVSPNKGTPRPQNTIILTMGTPKKVPLLGNPQIKPDMPLPGLGDIMAASSSSSSTWEYRKLGVLLKEFMGVI